MDARSWTEITLAATMPVGILGMLWNRHATKKSLSARSIQFLGLVLLVPLIGILSIEKILEGAIVGTLIGGLTGYLLSGISNYDKQGSSDA
jgi:hypothetical protein